MNAPRAVYYAFDYGATKRAFHKRASVCNYIHRRLFEFFNLFLFEQPIENISISETKLTRSELNVHVPLKTQRLSVSCVQSGWQGLSFFSRLLSSMILDLILPTGSELENGHVLADPPARGGMNVGARQDE